MESLVPLSDYASEHDLFMLIGFHGSTLFVMDGRTRGQCFQLLVSLIVSCRETLGKVVAMAFILKVSRVLILDGD